MTSGMPRLIFRNVLRKKLRVTFTALAMAMVVTAFVSIRAVQTAWTNQSNYAHLDRLTIQDSVSYAVLLPKQYVSEVQKLPHVKMVTWYNWMGARDPLHPTEFFATLAIDPDHYFDVFWEIILDESARAAWREKRNAAIVGEVLAAKMGWKVGDRLSLESGLYHEQPQWNFEIVGLNGVEGRSLNRSSVYVRWDYFNELASSHHNERVGWIVTTIDDPARTAQVASSIDAHFEDRGQQTFTQSQQAFLSSFASGMNMMMKALTLACCALVGIMMLLVGNTISMGVRERAQEFATLRAIGFTSKHVATLIVGEAIVLGTFGGLLGLIFAYPLVDRGIGRWISSNMDALLPYFRVGADTAGLALAAAIAVAGIAALLPAYRIFNLSVSEALRRVA